MYLYGIWELKIIIIIVTVMWQKQGVETIDVKIICKNK